MRRQCARDTDVLAFLKSSPAAAAPGPLRAGPDIYESIGVEPIINCRGTFTIIGGSVARREVVEAMEAAGRKFVQMDELAEGVGRRLAVLTGAPWGIVTAGCAAALKMVTAACVAGGHPEKLHRIPHLTGLEKTEVIIPHASNSAYDFAIQNIGVKIIRVGTPEEMEKALSARTAMIKLSSGSLALEPAPLGLEAVVRMAAKWKVPVLADAAAENLTIPNVHLKRGADVVAYSGGKAICGPQCAGLVLGRKDLLMSAWQANAPHHGPGRDNKVGREETLGMLAAVEAWVKRDHEADWRTWLSWLDHISQRVSTIDGVTTAIHEPEGLNNRSPSLSITWDPQQLNLTGEDVSEELAGTKPRVAVGAGNRRSGGQTGVTGISITAFQMQPGDEKIVADRAYAVLTQKHSPLSDEMKPATVNVSGRWEVDVEFLSSKSRHTFVLEQDGNWVRGVHHSDFSVRDVVGMVEGDQITMQSDAPRPAVTYIFTATSVQIACPGPSTWVSFWARISPPNGPPHRRHAGGSGSPRARRSQADLGRAEAMAHDREGQGKMGGEG